MLFVRCFVLLPWPVTGLRAGKHGSRDGYSASVMSRSIDVRHWAARGEADLVQNAHGEWWMKWWGRNLFVYAADGKTITSEDITRTCCDRNGFRPPRVVYLKEA